MVCIVFIIILKILSGVLHIRQEHVRISPNNTSFQILTLIIKLNPIKFRYFL